MGTPGDSLSLSWDPHALQGRAKPRHGKGLCEYCGETGSPKQACMALSWSGGQLRAGLPPPRSAEGCPGWPDPQ